MVYYQTYLSDKDLQQLKNHKYSGVDNSILSKLFLNRFWNALVTKLPLWLAPNTITLLGLIIVAISVLFVLNVENQENPWLWVFVAFALMTYTTLDAIDGKQARRTNSSSPLGELFDHGVDSLNTTLGCIPLVYTLSLQHTWALPLFIAVAHTYFYSATWETYHTHTLRLGIINGPVEGTFTICIVYLISAYFGESFFDLIKSIIYLFILYFVIFFFFFSKFLKTYILINQSINQSNIKKGPSMWLGSYKEMFGLQHTSLPDFQMNTLLLSLPLITTFAACFESLPPVISHCRSHNLSLLRAFSRFSPFILYITSFYFWLSGSKIEIVTSSLMMLFTYAVGLEFGMMMVFKFIFFCSFFSFFFLFVLNLFFFK